MVMPISYQHHLNAGGDAQQELRSKTAGCPESGRRAALLEIERRSGGGEH